MPTTKWRAIVFDLFGTLVKGANLNNHTAYLEKTISVLGADPESFLKMWSTEEMLDFRATGKLASAREILEEACRRIDLVPGEQELQAAIDLRFQAFKTWLEPRPDAGQVIQNLKNQGFKLALMSDCTADVPPLWPDLPFAKLFDVALFSCVLGIRKPNPRFYAMACEKLKVQPEQCLYIGDGASSELTGATRAGMQAVLITVSDQNDEVLPREDAQNWTGPRAQSLTQILDIAFRGKITGSQ